MNVEFKILDSIDLDALFKNRSRRRVNESGPGMGRDGVDGAEQIEMSVEISGSVNWEAAVCCFCWVNDDERHRRFHLADAQTPIRCQ